jgi:hypothetical protein
MVPGSVEEAATIGAALSFGSPCFFSGLLVCLAPLPACPIREDKALVQWIPALKAGSFMILVSGASHTIGSQIPTKNFQYSQKKSNHIPDKPFHIPVTLHRTISWVF